MPPLRDVRPRDAARAFQRAGGTLTAGGKGYINIKMPNGALVTFSATRSPMRIGLLKDMIKKAGLTDAQFMDLLK